MDSTLVQRDTRMRNIQIAFLVKTYRLEGVFPRRHPTRCSFSFLSSDFSLNMRQVWLDTMTLLGVCGGSYLLSLF